MYGIKNQVFESKRQREVEEERLRRNNNDDNNNKSAVAQGLPSPAPSAASSSASGLRGLFSKSTSALLAASAAAKGRRMATHASEEKMRSNGWSTGNVNCGPARQERVGSA